MTEESSEQNVSFKIESQTKLLRVTLTCEANIIINKPIIFYTHKQFEADN